ncbi:MULTISPECIES: hypothetical protein [unclassified Streptomyces]|uniref:hypothetical protein n=1 Tax=unclassified Streptomyces TaxID=2593676 RepID=UPI00336AC83F
MRWLLGVSLYVVIAVITAALGYQVPKSSSLRQAATAAADDGVELWVATAETSAHVSGDAADLGRCNATVWLAEHGAEYGLCQIYRNEPWHYERRTDAVDGGCPRVYADPTQDPRMQQ